MSDNSMLDRLAATLKRDIAPAIDDEYAKTQAYMASVVVGKLGRQLALAAAHRQAAETDMQGLLVDLKRAIGNSPHAAVLAPYIESLDDQHNAAALCAFIESLYAIRNEIGTELSEKLLKRIREVLRLDIDRRMEFAR